MPGTQALLGLTISHRLPPKKGSALSIAAWWVAGGRKVCVTEPVPPLSILLQRGPQTSSHACSQCVWPGLEGQPDHLLCEVLPRPHPPPWLSLDLGDRYFRGRGSPEPKRTPNAEPAGPGWRGPASAGSPARGRYSLGSVVVPAALTAEQ